MARPKSFDRALALQRAIEVFADYGYEGTSTDMLLEAMGVSRQSMYDTFGTKRELFLLSLSTYNSHNAQRVLDDLAGCGSAVETLRYAVTEFVQRTYDYPNASCLTTHAISEFGTRDEEVLHAGSGERLRMLSVFNDLIETGQAEGTIRRDINAAITADFLISSLAGLRISARAGVSTEELAKMVELLIIFIRA